MSSSISSSDASSPRQTGRRFLRAFGGTAVAGCAAVLALLALADPFDTARLTPFVRAGAPLAAPRMANASRARDPRFDAAIIGNSTLQLLAPERLQALTGHRFVQLTTPGTGPLEQAALADYLFDRRGEGLLVLVLGLDRAWCDAGREGRTAHPFPFWLYDLSDLTYLQGLFRASTLPFLARRMAMLSGRGRSARPDGYWDYEALGLSAGQPADAIVIDRIPGAGPDGRAAADLTLRRVLAAAPASTRILLVHPPVFSPTPPQATAEDRANLDRCKAALAAVAAGRAGAEILDLWVDDESTRDRSLFRDAVHVKRPFAQRIEAAIAERLGR
jgi:hypothetical protein